MASNRGPNAIGSASSYASSSHDSTSYARARDNNAFSWAQQGGGSNTGVTPSTGGVGGSWASVSTGGGPSVASQAREPPFPTNHSQPYVGVTSNSTTALSSSSRGGGGTAVSDGTYEKNLILELCPPGGMKAEPPPDKLANFARAVPSLNPDLVCPALLDCLEDGQPWIIRAKALCVMETCISVGEQGGSNKYADFFFTCRAEVEPLANHPRAAIKEPARRVLTLLGITPAVTDAPKPPTSAPPPPPAPVAPAADLLDFGGEVAQPPAAAPPVPPPAANASLFGGLKTKETATPAPASAPPPPPPENNLLGEVPLTQSSTGSLFDSMNVKTTTTTAAAPAPAAQPSAFGFVQEEAAAPKPAPAGSGFDFIAKKTEEAPAAAAPPAPAAAGSAFDFMGGGAAAAPVADSTAAPAPAKESFDPLDNGYKPSPSNQKNMMDVRQLQVMYAQQQNMLMMQQMQQMQLAMAMQQGGAAGMPAIPVMPGGVQHRSGSNPNVMAGAGKAGIAATSSFSFLDVGAQPPSKKNEDKSFDFISATIQNEKKK